MIQGLQLKYQQIHYWEGSLGINNAAWIVPLLLSLVVVQYFGVKGYGEVRLLDDT